MTDPNFRAALYLASPGFYRRLEAKRFDRTLMSPRELLSINKYLNRMHFRPTPFGLFSAFSVVSWGAEKQLKIDDAAGSLLHVQTDQQINVETRKYLATLHISGVYRVNPTLYRQGNEFRFLKSGTAAGSTKLVFSLESIEANSLTAGLVKFIGPIEKSDKAITNYLIRATNCTYPEAIGYVAFLRDAQVLKSKADINILGEDELAAKMPKDVQSALKTIIDPGDFSLSSERIDNGVLPGLKTRAGRIEHTLKHFAIASPDKIFYANTERRAITGTLSEAYQPKLVRAVDALMRLSHESNPQPMEDFKRAFIKRFEGRKIPLLQAMDPDSGVGYGNLEALVNYSPLLNSVGFKEEQRTSNTINWTAAHRLLFEKWQQSDLTGKIIALDGEDLGALPDPNELTLPPSFPVIFRIVQNRVLIENAGGVTATALIGRFTPLSAVVMQLSRDIASEEIARNPGVLFAELGQLSDHHNDNVNRRVNCYDYEIPINSTSLNPEEQVIHLRDLYVSVKNNEVMLESCKHNKPVIPRLSSAYNFQHNELAVFRFLCDLQYQSLHSGFSFDLEHFFPGLTYYPRVQAGDTIIGLAKWNLKSSDLQPETEQPALTVKSVLELKKRMALPDWLALKKSDQQLVFNLKEPDQLRLFADCITGMKQFTIQEFLVPDKDDKTLVDTNGKLFINQFIAFMINNKEVYVPKQSTGLPVRKLKRNFIIGSEWVYFKIYCTPVTSNELLISKVLPIIKKLKKEEHFSWFFIRYNDPGAHIRLRIKVREERVGHVIALLKNSFEHLIGDSVIREYKADTYQRELERYGTRSMEAIENFFCAGSAYYLNYLAIQSRRTVFQAHQFAAINFAAILEIFLPEIDGQIAFIDRIFQSFFLEFKGDKALRIELDERYRKLKEDFNILPETGDVLRQTKMGGYHKMFRQSVEAVTKTIAGGGLNKHSLIADMIHMQLNRVFTDQQRKQEMVTYYCFYKYKLSQRARMNAR